jgi:NADP-dependent 3-hydroxy-3-methylglutaryl-CoA reductase
VTPLTIPQKSSRHSHPGDELFRPVPRRVDTSKPAIQAVLSAFNSQMNGTDSSKSILAKVNSDIVISVADLAFPESDPPQKQIMNKLSLLTERITSSPTTMKKVLSDFLDAWTLLVSDPLMSKWVVIVLGVSMVLNGLLLRGLVEREAGPGPESESDAPVSASSTLAIPRAEEKQSNLARSQKSSDRIRWEPGTEMRGNGSMSVSHKGSLLGLRSAAAAASGSGRVSPSTIGFSSAVQSGPPGYNFPLSEASGSSSGRGSLRLEDVDRKLERVGGTIHEGVPHTLGSHSQTPGTPSSRRRKFIVGGKGSSESSDEADAAPAPASAAPAPAAVVAIEKPKPHRSLTAPPEQLAEQQTGPAGPGRELKALVELYTSTAPGAAQRSLLMGLTDEEILALSKAGKIPAYGLEKALGGENVVGDGWDGPVGREYVRAVRIRRGLVEPTRPVDKSEKAREEFDLEFKTVPLGETEVPFENYDYTKVFGACCENVVGYVPIPLGIAGPLHIDGKMVPIPMATAEGTLVASTSRGSKALNASGGVKTVVLKDGMTRGPAIEFPSLEMAYQAYRFLDPTNVDGEEGYELVKAAFESTSRFAKLNEIKCALAGRTLFVRFCTRTGDAMGMNMISKATEKGLATLQMRFPDMLVLALSGNYCADKKPTAINWIEGRGKSVVAEAVIKGDVVKSVLKTNVETLVKVNTKKNLVGSAMAGAMGGFNAHAANILTAIFLATGQDPAQNVESSQCMTLMES